MTFLLLKSEKISVRCQVQEINTKSGTIFREIEVIEKDAGGVQGETKRRTAVSKQGNHKRKHKNRKTSQQKVSYKGQEIGPVA